MTKPAEYTAEMSWRTMAVLALLNSHSASGNELHGFEWLKVMENPCVFLEATIDIASTSRRKVARAMELGQIRRGRLLVFLE
jgi:hypothetical protein